MPCPRICIHSDHFPVFPALTLPVFWHWFFKATRGDPISFVLGSGRNCTWPKPSQREYVAVPWALMSDKHQQQCSNLDTESRLGLSSMLTMTKICQKYGRQNALFLAFRASHEGCLLTRVPVCRSKLGKNWVVCMLTSSRVAWLPSLVTFVGPYNGTSSVNCWAMSVLNCNSGGNPRLAKPRQQHFGSWREVGLGEDSWDAHRKNVNSCLASCD